MKKPNSISLLILGVVLLATGRFIDNLLIRYALLIASILISIYAVVKSFEERKNNR